MSYANPRKVRRQRLRAVAKRATEVQGCTCSPDYRVGSAHGLDNVKVLHDAWCPLYQVGRFVAVYRPDAFKGCER